MKSKIARFGLVFAEKSNSEVERNFRKSEDRKPKLKMKLNYKLMIHDEILEGKHIF